MCLHMLTSYASVGGTRKFFGQTPIMDAILMGYWVAGHVRTMMISVMYKSKSRMGDMTLRRFLMIKCEMFLRENLRSTSRTALLSSGRGIVYGLGDEL